MSTALHADLATVGGKPLVSRAEAIYRELRRELLIGKIPFSQRLVEEQLADRFGCSRTPVREALRLLEGDGHLVKDERGRLGPNPPRVAAMQDLYQTRIAIEDLLVRRAAESGDRDQLAHLETTWSELQVPGDYPDFLYADEAFHRAIASAAGNQAAARYLEDINDRIRILRIYDFTSSERIETTILEHRAIAHAVTLGEAGCASSLMRIHIERSACVVEERVGAALVRMLDQGHPPATTSTERAA